MKAIDGIPIWCRVSAVEYARCRKEGRATAYRCHARWCSLAAPASLRVSRRTMNIMVVSFARRTSRRNELLLPDWVTTLPPLQGADVLPWPVADIRAAERWPIASRTSSSVLPASPFAAAKPRRSGTVSRSQTMTLPFMRASLARWTAHREGCDGRRKCDLLAHSSDAGLGVALAESCQRDVPNVPFFQRQRWCRRPAKSRN